MDGRGDLADTGWLSAAEAFAEPDMAVSVAFRPDLPRTRGGAGTR
jgi:hypothetical protein